MRKYNDRGLFRIGDVAEITKLPVHTLRYWEGMFREVITPCRSKGGQRRYSEVDVEKILKIKRLLKEEGYSIAGAKRTLKNNEREKGLTTSYQRRELNWSHIAREVTKLIRERLSESCPPEIC